VGLGFRRAIAAYLLSGSLPAEEVPDAIVVWDDAVGFVKGVKNRQGKDLWLFGGGRLFASLLQAGFVDAVEVATVPFLLGEGIPLLPVSSRVPLHLERTEAFPSGIVENRDHVRSPGPAGHGSDSSTESVP
jgi:dihydrofolate reductase